MSTLRIALAAALALAAGAAARRNRPNLGQAITPGDLAPWDIGVMPDGTGLPPAAAPPCKARRSMPRNARPATARTARAANGAMVGGPPRDRIEARKTIANFWPYATTIFDFIRRAMPREQPKSLTDQEVYALTAYLLSLNKLIGETDVINAKTLPAVKMPNAQQLHHPFPERI